ncbi:hypothetical protein PUNSTDRAFT_133708 [Punctularia strigosozonata HHB-11173 SS5]|uniref:uncharacterized protein n=1 Tax=Punctularia strigosozonata (strain HHB-11173) TaxID=741275 RepID=UPI0004417CDA|nr:uncharacterized protein PUNSTDRAFT_133708 [Punctularia strigosozonata HHB-11173 SS5]EIN09935.1 hypothetical protein PUNSTDRAFT_133708 [Punctularia strigosozonata HHB-11173 SS5]
MPASIEDLPTELLFKITVNVDKRRDLAALAATCRACYAFCSAPEVQYRSIYARSVDVTLLWRFLAANPSRASEVRLLSIGARTPKDHIPRGFREEKRGHLEEAEFALCDALKMMKNLTSFTWESGWKRQGRSPCTGNRIWDTLRMSCPTLHTLIVEDQPAPGISSMFTSSLFLLSHLRYCSITIASPFPSRYLVKERLRMLLERCTDLCVLRITHVVPSIVPLSEIAIDLCAPHLHTLAVIHQPPGAPSTLCDHLEFIGSGYRRPIPLDVPTWQRGRSNRLPRPQASAMDCPFPSLRTLIINSGSFSALPEVVQMRAPLPEIRGLPVHLVGRFAHVKIEIEALRPTLRKIVFGDVPSSESAQTEAKVYEGWIKKTLPNVELSHSKQG